MITLSIKKVSESYNKKVREYNENIKVKRKLNKLGFCSTKINNYKEECTVCYLLEILYTGSNIGKVLFGYKHDADFDYSKNNYAPDFIIGTKNNEVKKSIYEFCSNYGLYLLQGYDIIDLAQNDQANTLNYKIGNRLVKKM